MSKFKIEHGGLYTDSTSSTLLFVMVLSESYAEPADNPDLNYSRIWLSTGQVSNRMPLKSWERGAAYWVCLGNITPLLAELNNKLKEKLDV